MLKKKALVLACALFLNSLSIWAFSSLDCDRDLIDQAIKAQSPIIEFMTVTSLPIKIVDELFSSYNTMAPSGKKGPERKHKKENRDPSDLYFNTSDKPVQSWKWNASFSGSAAEKTGTYIPDNANHQGSALLEAFSAIILLFLLSYLIVLRRRSLPDLIQQIALISEETRHAFNRVFLLVIWR